MTGRRPDLGVVEWFEVGEHERVEQVLADLRALGIERLRTGLSWADWYTPEGEEWYTWLFPRLAREVEVLPCYLYTPPSIGLAPRTSAPPRRPREYADVLDLILDRIGDHFEYVELWNEPNNLSEWDWTLDPGWSVFSEMVIDAAHWARVRGKKTVLGGMSPVDPRWIALMWERGVMDHIDAMGVHGFPGTWEASWRGWDDVVERVRSAAKGRTHRPELWITEVGYSTWRHDDRSQAECFLEVLEADVERVYWYSVHDLDPRRPTVDGFHSDEREYHFGFRRADGGLKLLGRMLEAGGIDAVEDIVRRTAPAVHTRDADYTLVTGGSGFIGTNLAHRLLENGEPVRLLDNLSRPGVEENLRELQRSRRGAEITVGDVRDAHLVEREVERAGRVFHLAAQVAVTTSLHEPVSDFEVNARGTLNVLQAAARRRDPPPVVFTSTNKVYGALAEIELRATERRYEPTDPEVRTRGISEAAPLRFHSPYGCSKGAADQYALDYARTLGVPATVFRLSCVYGPRQFGTEDQGWVAHFLIRALERRPITVFGDGRQVRDILYVDDLVDALVAAARRTGDVGGRVFNVGGGPGRTVSLLEFFDLLEALDLPRPRVEFAEARPGDQRWYVSDPRKAEQVFGWSPRVSPPEGVRRLLDWLVRRPWISERTSGDGRTALTRVAAG